jgi:Pentapeptide repeats (8 copies)
MASEEHLRLLRQIANYPSDEYYDRWDVWDAWRDEHPDIVLDLSGVDFHEDELLKALKACPLGAFRGVNLAKANLAGLDPGMDLSDTDLREANLAGADLRKADLRGADLRGANLVRADLSEAEFTGGALIGANLTQADLTRARLIEADFREANLTGRMIYGISAWGVQLAGAIQTSLIITQKGEPTITVDSLEVAQFIYLPLYNEKIRAVIDTITSKAVLILGRFTPERKAVLDAIREELRHRNYLPILFDFEAPGSRDFTETISTLAHMARFIIADLTEPSSLPKELEAIVPTLAVPVQPVLEGATRPYSMFQDYWKYHWVLKVHRYNSLEGLITSLGDLVIAPAEVKVKELEETRRDLAEELLKQRSV